MAMAAGCGENVSATQFVQTVLLSASCVYVPDAQFWQAPALVCRSSADILPAAQRSHLDSASRPTCAENLPAPHDRHVSLWVAPRLAE